MTVDHGPFEPERCDTSFELGRKTFGSRRSTPSVRTMAKVLEHR
jgi:hypothetical protein